MARSGTSSMDISTDSSSLSLPPSPSPALVGGWGDATPLDMPLDDGFMVVPVWDPVREEQIGSVVWEDPFIGFPNSKSPHAALASDVAFVGPTNGQEEHGHSETAESFVAYNNDGDGKSGQEERISNYNTYSTQHQINNSMEFTQPQNMGWWEENGSVGLLEGMSGEEELLGFVDEATAAIDSSAKSPEDILNEIYEEVKSLEKEDERRSDDNGWWSGNDNTDSSSAPTPDPNYSFNNSANNWSEKSHPTPSLPSTAAPPILLQIHSKAVVPLPLKGASSLSKVKSGGVRKRAGKGREKGDAKERKKEQNREAATRYRDKKRTAKDILANELMGVEKRNKELKTKEEDLRHEIAYLKGLMKQVRGKKREK